MKIAIYNQMFGLDGRSLLASLVGHLMVHCQRKPERIWKRVNISKSIDTVLESNADIVGILEVLEGQEEKLKGGLKKGGYDFFYMGNGYKLKYSGLHVQEMIASKIMGKQRDIGECPIGNRLRGGGDLAHVYYPQPQFHLILVHLDFLYRKYYWEQVSFLQNYLERLDGKVVISGDFSLPYQRLKQHLPDFDLISGEVKTCSSTPIIKWFYNKDLDHILVRGFKSIECGTIEGNSDHKLVYACIGQI